MWSISGARILMIAPFDKSGGVSTHTKSLIKELEKRGAVITVINTMTRMGWRPDRMDPITLLDHSMKLMKWLTILPIRIFLSRNKVDIVHIQASGPLGGFMPAVIGSFMDRFFGLPTVITFHYSKTDRFVDEHPTIIQKVIGRSHAFIVVSDRQARRIRAILPSSDRGKVHAIPNGFDPDRFTMIDVKKAKEELGIPLGTKVLVNVAWVMEKKGHIYLIQAIEELVRNEQKDIVCYVIGKGPLLARMKREVDKRGLGEKIRFLGFLPHDDMVLYMNAADIFVISSLNEGNPIVMFEALGLGKPIISTNVGGIPEIVNSDKIGILVPPSDGLALAKAIDQGLGKEWNEEFLSNISKRFTWDVVTGSTVSVYDQVLRS